MEIIHDGWLIKLSSDRRLFRKRKWNKYWFVLLHSAHHSGQVVLEYYKDSNCHNLKGRIDLGQCEQLDSGLQFGKEENVANNGFDIRTGNKTYCLIAETAIEMNNWVGCISSVCGLKLKVEDDQAAAVSSENGTEPVTSPPLISSAENEMGALGDKKNSSPYILISECFTGKPLPNWPSNIDDLNYSSPREAGSRLPFSNYDYPRPICLKNKQDISFQNNFLHELYQIPPPPRVCETDFCNKIYSYPDSSSNNSSEELQTFEGINLGNNIFLYNDGPAIYHEDSDIEIVRKEALQLAQQLESLGLDDSSIEYEKIDSLHDEKTDSLHDEKTDSLQNPFNDCTNKMHFQSKDVTLDVEVLVPPPRPPKPLDLQSKKSPNLIPPSNKKGMFDFPLSSKTTDTDSFCWAAQTMESADNSILQSHSEITPELLDDMYDIPKPRNEDNLTILLTASSLHLKGRNLHVYDNAPPMFTKSSVPVHEHDASFGFGCEAETPLMFLVEQSVESNIKDCDVVYQDKCYDSPPLVNRNLKPKRTILEKDVDEKLDQIVAQSPDLRIETSCIHSESDEDKRIVDLDTCIERPPLTKINEIQYLDLNLDDDITNDTSKLEASQAKRTTVYKTVDFLRTEAFNKMRQNVEAAYRSSH